jgi:hypothetical protein
VTLSDGDTERQQQRRQQEDDLWPLRQAKETGDRQRRTSSVNRSSMESDSDEERREKEE